MPSAAGWLWAEAEGGGRRAEDEGRRAKGGGRRAEAEGGAMTGESSTLFVVGRRPIMVDGGRELRS